MLLFRAHHIPDRVMKMKFEQFPSYSKKNRVWWSTWENSITYLSMPPSMSILMSRRSNILCMVSILSFRLCWLLVPLPVIMRLLVLLLPLRRSTVSTTRLRRGRTYPWDPLVAIANIRRLFINLSIIPFVIHLSNKANNSHLSNLLQLLPIHASWIPLVFIPKTHKIINRVHRRIELLLRWVESTILRLKWF